MSTANEALQATRYRLQDVMQRGRRGPRRSTAPEPVRAQQRRAADCLQPTLRSGFRQQLTPSVRLHNEERRPQITATIA